MVSWQKQSCQYQKMDFNKLISFFFINNIKYLESSNYRMVKIFYYFGTMR